MKGFSLLFFKRVALCNIQSVLNLFSRKLSGLPFAVRWGASGCEMIVSWESNALLRANTLWHAHVGVQEALGALLNLLLSSLSRSLYAIACPANMSKLRRFTIYTSHHTILYAMQYVKLGLDNVTVCSYSMFIYLDGKVYSGIGCEHLNVGVGGAHFPHKKYLQW